MTWEPMAYQKVARDLLILLAVVRPVTKVEMVVVTPRATRAVIPVTIATDHGQAACMEGGACVAFFILAGRTDLDLEQQAGSVGKARQP